MLRNKKRIAIKLRLLGQSYSDIRTRVAVSKSTLSLWLRNYPLSPGQLNKLMTRKRVVQIERFRTAMKNKREIRMGEEYLRVKAELYPLTERDFLIAGLFLYLGEGAKSSYSRIQILNSDPNIIKFCVFWLTKILKINKDKLRIQVHLYKDMDISNELIFWQKTTSLSRNQFIKPYIKKTSSQKIDHPSFGHGTCNVYTHQVELKQKIISGIQLILNSVSGM